MAPSFNADDHRVWLHRVSNRCQVLIGMAELGAHDATIEQLSHLETLLQDAPSTCLERFAAELLVRLTLLRLSLKGVERSACCWRPTGVPALSDVTPLDALVREMKSALLPGTHRIVSLSDRILGYVQAHHTNESLCEHNVAEALGISRATICRILRRHIGVSFRTLVRRVRIAHAERLLSTALSLKEIAAAVGYSHASELSRNFVRCRNMTPTRCRLIMREGTERPNNADTHQ